MEFGAVDGITTPAGEFVSDSQYDITTSMSGILAKLAPFP